MWLYGFCVESLLPNRHCDGTDLQSLCYPSLQPLLPPRLLRRHTPRTLANTGLSTESSFQAQGCLVVCPDHLFPTLPGSSLLRGLRLHAIERTDGHWAGFLQHQRPLLAETSALFLHQ